MPRLWLTLALALEAALAALLALAVAYGRLDHGAAFYAVLGGALAVGAWQVVRWLSLDRAVRLVTHGALVAGCVLFSFPFVWLVGTSFKYDEEIFVYPPRWVPAAPHRVVCSPYVTAESLEDLGPPEGLERQRWPEVWQTAEPRLWERGAGLLGPGAMAGLDSGQVRAVLTHGLFVQAARGVPRTLWSEATSRVVESLCARVDTPLAASVWERVHRALELRTPSVRDTGSGIHVLADSGAYAWQPAQGAVRLAPGESAAGGAAATTVAYDFTQGDRVAVETVLPLPVPATQVHSIIVPMRQDRSWHRLGVELEMDG